jgi:hypothetical protein
MNSNERDTRPIFKSVAEKALEQNQKYSIDYVYAMLKFMHLNEVLKISEELE